MAVPNKPMSGANPKSSTTSGKPTNAPAQPQRKPGVAPSKPAPKSK